MTDLPDIALSVRQPWAWAIIHGGKDVENRTWQAVNRGLGQRGRIAIHAAKGMTQEEYRSAADFMARIGVACPPPADLRRGGIIGSVEVVDVVREHESPWFSGPRGLVLRDPRPCAFIEAPGALGYFRWQAGPTGCTPARWMLPTATMRAHEHERVCSMRDFLVDLMGWAVVVIWMSWVTILPSIGTLWLFGLLP